MIRIYRDAIYGVLNGKYIYQKTDFFNLKKSQMTSYNIQKKLLNFAHIKKNMKRALLLLCLLTFFDLTNAQSSKENKKLVNTIKTDSKYYYGESTDCENIDECNNIALDALMENIEHNFKANIIYISNDDAEEWISKVFGTFKKLISTSSDQIIADDNHILRYIKKDDFAEICNERERNIHFYLKEAYDKEQQMMTGDALKYYYWSALLCLSHPNGNEILCIDPETNIKVPAYKWIVNHINDMLNDINIVPNKYNRNDDVIELVFTNNGDYVSNLSYQYYDGQSMRPMRVNNGKSQIQLKNKDIDKIDIRIDTEFRNEAENFDRTVFSVMTTLNKQIHMTGANKTVSIEKLKVTKEQPHEYQREDLKKKQENTNNLIDEYGVDEKKYIKSMEIIEKALRNRKIEDAKSCFSPEGYDMLQRLARFGNMSVIGLPQYKFLHFNNEVICRSITMQFDFKNNAGFSEDVVFRFDDSTGLVTSIAFRLTDMTEFDILGKKQWDERSRLTLINFLEDYQTAYALKRIDYLDQIFSDDALIIVGRVMQRRKLVDGVYYKDESFIELNQKTKAEYIKSLNRAFNSREYINLKFRDTNFIQAANGENLFGVQIKQEYYSNSYSDVGYLFLIVDLREKLPCIHVRTWQPNKTKIEDLINLNNFRFN